MHLEIRVHQRQFSPLRRAPGQLFQRAEWLQMITAEELAERMKKEIFTDIRHGIVPCSVATFSGLHDYIDANCCGETEASLDELDAAVPDIDDGHITAMNVLRLNEHSDGNRKRMAREWVCHTRFHEPSETLTRCQVARLILLSQPSLR